MRTVGVALVTLAVGLLGSPLAAQQFESVPRAQSATAAPTAAGVNIGVIDFQAAMVNTQEGKKAAEDLRAEFQPRRVELDKLRREVLDLENQLRTQERTLSNEARRQLVRQIEQKRKAAARMDQDLRDDAEQAQNDVINRLGQKVQNIINQYAQQNNLSLVLNLSPDGSVVFAHQTVNITDEVIALYDKTYPAQTTAGATPPSPSSQP